MLRLMHHPKGFAFALPVSFALGAIDQKQSF